MHGREAERRVGMEKEWQKEIEQKQKKTTNKTTNKTKIKQKAMTPLLNKQKPLKSTAD